MQMTEPKLVVIGASAGGVDALQKILQGVSKNVPFPIVVVLHIPPYSKDQLRVHLASYSALPVKEIEDKEPIRNGTLYVAPADYHVLIEKDSSFSLSNEEPVHFSRPSIDVLFESAAMAFKEGVLGIILTGANPDGAQGLQRITECGGQAIVQDPETAEFPEMPAAALLAAKPLAVYDLAKISEVLKTWNR